MEKEKIYLTEEERDTLRKYNIDPKNMSSFDELLFTIDKMSNDTDLDEEEMDELEYVANNVESSENAYKFLRVLLVMVLVVSISVIVSVGMDIKTKIDEERTQNNEDKIEQILQEIDDEGLNYPSKI